MSEGFLKWAKIIVPLVVAVVVFLVFGGLQILAPRTQIWLLGGPAQSSIQVMDSALLLHGKAATLSWIVGRDCQRGMQAYLQSADTHPDAALVGAGWIDPTNGRLILGESNNCEAGSLSMDGVVRQIHGKGGMAYLTITMSVNGVPGSWTPRQQGGYIEKATTTPGYIDAIVREVQRANYDGVIMDLESSDPAYPNIQQLFATYNQRIWEALKPLNKFYGIALAHKLSDHDEYYYLNGFQDWRKLAHSADFLVVMALDQSYRTPGPMVSVPWLKQLLAYARQTMPDMLARIVWELPLYGASWHMQGGGWVFEGGIDYVEAQKRVEQVPDGSIDAKNSDLKDAASAHLVYTDAGGVKRALWYHTAQNLYNIVLGFHQALDQVPELKDKHMQIAMWYRQTSEPGAVWDLIAPLLPNE